MKQILALTLVLSFAAGQDFKSENKPDNLKAYFVKMRSANEKSAASMARALFCGEARAKLALKDGTSAEFLGKVVSFHKEVLDSPDDKAAAIFRGKAEQTEIQVHASTVEALSKYESGSVAFAEFPGGARKLAQTVLRPGLTFYEVELLEPGKDAGMKYHLFFWDGKSWASLGPVWRFLPKD